LRENHRVDHDGEGQGDVQEDAGEQGHVNHLENLLGKRKERKKKVRQTSMSSSEKRKREEARRYMLRKVVTKDFGFVFKEDEERTDTQDHQLFVQLLQHAVHLALLQAL
jgi:hypothetical protein